MLPWLKDKAVALISTAIVAGVAGVLYFIWDDLLAKFNEYIIEIVNKSRMSDVGALSTGHFSLTPHNRQYTLYLYCPQRHTGKVFVQIEGSTDTRYVEFLNQNGKKDKIEQGSSLSIENPGEDHTLEHQGIDVHINKQAQMKDVMAVTFQLSGPDADDPTKQDDLTNKIEVSYVALISPTIRLENK
jgi:hypothetical protein